MELEIGKSYDLNCLDVDRNGFGIAKLYGSVILVRDLIPGEQAQVSLISRKRNFWIGKKISTSIISTERINPRCKFATLCGGCTLQHINSRFQSTIKFRQLIEALNRIGGVDYTPDQVLKDNKLSLGYRNRAIIPIKRIGENNYRFGYFKQSTHQIVDIDECNVLDPRLSNKLGFLKDDISRLDLYADPEYHIEKGIRHIALRIGSNSGEILITIISSTGCLFEYRKLASIWMKRWKDVVGVTLNINSSRTNRIFGDKNMIIKGSAEISEDFCGLKITVDSTSFFQVNTLLAEKAISRILYWIRQESISTTIIDAYSGIGTISLPLAKAGFKVIGLEISKLSVKVAKQNCVKNNIDTVRFYYGDVASLLHNYLTESSFLIVDPPRKGLDIKVVETILEILPYKIIYMSCSPATLARDLNILVTRSCKYSIESILPMEFFPQTTHLETLVLLKSNS